MENNAELARLEQFVETLLNKYNELKDNFHSLEATLHERDNECMDLKNEIASLKDERTEVGSRVTGILDRIEQWEAIETEIGDVEEDGAGVQGSLFDQEEAN